MAERLLLEFTGRSSTQHASMPRTPVCKKECRMEIAGKRSGRREWLFLSCCIFKDVVAILASS